MTDYQAIGMAEGFVECPDEQTYFKAWQHLIDTGRCWTLQGWFGRTARDMIAEGLCMPAREIKDADDESR